MYCMNPDNHVPLVYYRHPLMLTDNKLLEFDLIIVNLLTLFIVILKQQKSLHSYSKFRTQLRDGIRISPRFPYTLSLHLHFISVAFAFLI